MAMFIRAANFTAKKSQWVVSCDPKVSYFLPSVHSHIFVSLLTLLLVVRGHENADGPNNFLLERAICTVRQH
jgi:hypothetical protein